MSMIVAFDQHSWPAAFHLPTYLFSHGSLQRDWNGQGSTQYAAQPLSNKLSQSNVDPVWTSMAWCLHYVQQLHACGEDKRGSRPIKRARYISATNWLLIQRTLQSAQVWAVTSQLQLKASSLSDNQGLKIWFLPGCKEDQRAMTLKYSQCPLVKWEWWSWNILWDSIVIWHKGWTTLLIFCEMELKVLYNCNHRKEFCVSLFLQMHFEAKEWHSILQIVKRNREPVQHSKPCSNHKVKMTAPHLRSSRKRLKNQKPVVIGELPKQLPGVPFHPSSKAQITKYQEF